MWGFGVFRGVDSGAFGGAGEEGGYCVSVGGSGGTAGVVGVEPEDVDPTFFVVRGDGLCELGEDGGCCLG